MKDWGLSRGRMEAEIARKKEHLNTATNFEKARGWTRKCWKTKNYKPDIDDLDEFLKFSSSEDEGGLSPGQKAEEPESSFNRDNSPGKSLRSTAMGMQNAPKGPLIIDTT